MPTRTLYVAFTLLFFAGTASSALAAPKSPYKRVCDCECRCTETSCGNDTIDIRVDGTCGGLHGMNCTIKDPDGTEHKGAVQNCGEQVVPASIKDLALSAEDLERLRVLDTDL